MKIKIDFLNDTEFKIVTMRGEEFVGHLTVRPAKTDEEKNMVIEKISYAFDISDTCSQAFGFIQNLAVEPIMFGLMFDTIVSPIEAQRKRIGSRLRELRESKGMTARELAFLCRIDPANISKIESGKHAAGLDILNRIAYFLDAEVQINPKPVEGNCQQSKYYRIYENMQ